MNNNMLNGQRVLITGVSGFLGLALCHQLNVANANVTGLDSQPVLVGNTSYERLLARPHQFVQFDLLDPQLDAFLAKQQFDVIFHLAGMAYAADSINNPASDFSNNLAASFRLLEALRRCRFGGRLVFASSAAVYGEPEITPITEGCPVRPISPYGISKLTVEEDSRVYAQQVGFEVAIARLFSLYGPRQQKQVVFDIMRKTLLSDKPITLFGDGQEVRDFVYVEDAARALMHLAHHATIDAPVFNVCSAEGITIRALASLIVKLAGQDNERITFSGNHRQGDPHQCVGCNTALIERGFSAEYSLITGLQATLRWFCQHHALTPTTHCP